MITQEIKRVFFTGKTIPTLFFFLLGLVVLCIFDISRDDIKASEYKKTSADVMNMKDTIDISRYSDGSSDDFSKYIIYSEIEKELKEVERFNNGEQLKRIQILLGFKNLTDRKSLKKLEKMSEDYSKIKAKKIGFTGSYGLYKGFVSLPFSITLLAVALYLSLKVFLTDSEYEINKFWGTMKKGRGKLFSSRMAVFFVSMLFFSIIMYCLLTVVYLLKYGVPVKGFLNMPVQSVAGLEGLTYNINIFGMSVIVILGSFFMSAASGIFFAALGFIRKGKIQVFLLLIAFIAAEAVAYLKINDNSYLLHFKQINIFQVLLWGRTVCSYELVYLFGNYFCLYYFASVIAVIFLLLSVCLCYIFSYKALFYEKKVKTVNCNKKNRGNNSKLWEKETKKYLFDRGGYSVLILMFLLCMWFGRSRTYQIDNLEEYYFRSYVYQYGGEISEIDTDRMQLILDEAEKEYEKYDLYSQAVDENKLNACLYRVNAIKRWFAELKECREKGSEYLIYKPDYELVFKLSLSNITVDYLIILVLILNTVVYIMGDKVCGMSDYAKSTKTGIRHFERMQKKVAFMLNALFGLLLMLYYRYGIIRKYKLRLAFIPASMLETFMKMPDKITLFSIFWGILMMNIIAISVFGALAVFICRRSERLYEAVAICFICLAFMYFTTAFLL